LPYSAYIVAIATTKGPSGCCLTLPIHAQEPPSQAPQDCTCCWHSFLYLQERHNNITINWC